MCVGGGGACVCGGGGSSCGFLFDVLTVSIVFTGTIQTMRLEQADEKLTTCTDSAGKYGTLH